LLGRAAAKHRSGILLASDARASCRLLTVTCHAWPLPLPTFLSHLGRAASRTWLPLVWIWGLALGGFDFDRFDIDEN
jgi:hypothetical protein